MIMWCRDFTFCLLLIGCIDVGMGLRCMSCKRTLEPWLCNIAKTCAPEENAYGLRHYKGVGELRYDTFCSTDTICSNTYHNTSLCDSCCHGDICNTRGCSSSDVCCLQRIRVWPFFYTSKCLPPSSCFGDSLIFGKRQSSQTLCGSTCCQSDLCNDNCNDSSMSTVVTTPSTVVPTDTNMEYLLMFPCVAHSEILYVLISTTSSGHLDVEVPHLAMTKTMPLTTGRNAIKFNNTLMMSCNILSTGVEHKGIYLKSSVPVAVFVISDNTYENSMSLEETEGFMVLPVEKLGRQYRVIRGAYAHGNEMINIASFNDNTEVNVQFEISGDIKINGHFYHSGSTYTVKLQRLDTLCLTLYSITGTTIRSDKPIAVVGGSQMSYNSNNPNIVFLPPVSELGTTFIIPPFPETPIYYIRLLLATDGEDAIVDVTNDALGTYQYRLSYTDVSKEITVHSEPVFITSTRPIYVNVKTYANNSIQPSLLSIPSVSNYRSNYSFPSPNSITAHDFDQFALVVIPSSKENGLMVNNILVHSSTATPTMQRNWNNYTFLAIPTDEPHIVISHVDNSVQFGALIFGKSRLRQGSRNARYAFPAGFQ